MVRERAHGGLQLLDVSIDAVVEFLERLEHLRHRLRLIFQQHRIVRRALLKRRQQVQRRPGPTVRSLEGAGQTGVVVERAAPLTMTARDALQPIDEHLSVDLHQQADTSGIVRRLVVVRLRKKWMN